MGRACNFSSIEQIQLIGGSGGVNYFSPLLFGLSAAGILTGVIFQQEQAPLPSEVKPSPPVVSQAPLPEFSRWPEFRMTELFQHPVGPLGLEYKPEAKALDGRQVRVLGFMARTDWTDTSVFLLAPHPIILHDREYAACDEIPSGSVLVKMPPGEQASFTPGLLMLCGTLHTQRVDAPGDRYLWASLDLDPQAKHWSPSPELLTSYTPQQKAQLDRLLTKQRNCACRSCKMSAQRDLLPLRKNR